MQEGISPQTLYPAGIKIIFKIMKKLRQQI